MAPEGATRHLIRLATRASATSRLHPEKPGRRPCNGPLCTHLPAALSGTPWNVSTTWAPPPGHYGRDQARSAVLSVNDVRSQFVEALRDRSVAGHVDLGRDFDRPQEAPRQSSLSQRGRPDHNHLRTRRTACESPGQADGEINRPATVLGQQEGDLHASADPRAASRLMVPRGPSTPSPPRIAARNVASEKSSAKPRGMRNSPVACRHHPGRAVTAEVKPAAP